MGRHSKPDTHSNTGPIVAVAIATSGAFSTVPLAHGTAQAATVETTAPFSAVSPSRTAVTEGPPGGWDAVVRCESNFNPRAHNRGSSASGLFQFLSGTWRSLGGVAFGPTAADASPEQQLEIANRAYARSGLTPWEASRSCWRRSRMRGSGRIQQLLAGGRHRVVAEPTPAPTQPQKNRTYRVVSGDTLSAIAVANGHTWQELFAENRAVLHNPNLLRVGEIINLP